MKNSKIIVITALALIAVLSFGGCKKSKNSDVKDNGNETKTVEKVNEKETETEIKAESGSEAAGENNVEQKAEEQKVYKPTFMYFVSSKDAGYDDYMKVLDKLQKEYKDTVVFDIKNVDENPEVLQNFEIVKGQTPTLIMLNTKNDISNFLFKNGNYDELKAAIDAALQ